MIRHAPAAVLILGTSSLAYKLAAAIESGAAGHQRVLGLLNDAPQGTSLPTNGACPIVGNVDQVERVLDALKPDRIIVALTERRGCLPVEQLLKARLRGVVVENGVKVYEQLTGKLAIESLRPSSLVFDRRLVPPRRKVALKRLFSIFFAAIGLVAALPVMAVIAVLIRLGSPGPIFFRQDRIGRDGRRFQLLKFRSMRVDGCNASEWEADNLARVTKLGYWLREFHLDELPQFLNILRGDMDFVGPRPHPVSNHALFEREIPYYSLRSIVRPGLTGWAQVRLGYANGLAEETDKMRYDLYYIKNQSLRLDAWIFLNTIRIVLFGRRADESGPSRSAETTAAVVEPVAAPVPIAQVRVPAPAPDATFTA